MTISLILAWFAGFFMLVTALKFVARKFGNDETNKFFRKIHMPMGIALVVAGLFHGIFAGNPSWSTLGDFAVAPVLFSFNWGSVLLIISISLGVTFMLRKNLKKHWMTAHRVLTVVAIVVFVLHLLDVGIQLPNRIVEAFYNENNEMKFADNGNIGTEDSTDKKDVENSEDVVAKTDNENTDEDSQTKPESSENTGEDSQTEPENNENTQSNILFSGAKLKDGTYSGQAEGYNGTIEVSVIVENGSVTSIEVVNHRETPQFFSRAKNILDWILNYQSLEVDAVSGATFSSAGLVNAVDNALKDAVVEGSLSKTEIDITNIRRHGHNR